MIAMTQTKAKMLLRQIFKNGSVEPKNYKGEYKMFTKKLFLAAIAAAPILLAACTPKSMEEESPGGLIGTEEADIFNETGFPIVKEPITLKVSVTKRPESGNYEQMPVITQIEEKSGINMDFQQIPNQSYGEKINLMFASGNVPDVVFSGTPNNFMLYAGELIQPLDEYIERYMPNLSSIFAQRPRYRGYSMRPDGKTYQLPGLEEYPQVETPANLFINKTWLDALGLDIPETTDEFYEVLQAFKEGDPNGNGKADEIPFSGLDREWWPFQSLRTLGGSFFFPMGPENLKVNADGKLEYVPLSEAEGFQSFVEYYQKLYQEGLVDLESFTQRQSEFFAKGSAKLLGSFIAWFDENVVGAEGVSDYVMLKPLTAPGGKSPRMLRVPTMSFFGAGALMSTQNPYPASTMRMMDIMYNPEFSWQIQLGPWDMNLERLPDGRVNVLAPPEGLNLREWRFNNSPGGAWPLALLEEERLKIVMPSKDVRKQERYEALKPFLPAVEQYLPILSFTAEENDELAILRTDINGYFNQQYANWITQGLDVREAWPGFVEQLENIGIARYVEIYQAAYDRYDAIE